MKKIKVAFLFQGARQNILESIRNGESPDTLVFGGNHTAEILKDTHECDFFNQRGLWETFKMLRSYDVVVSSIGLPILLLQRLLFHRHPRWIFINLNITSVLNSYPPLSFKRWTLLWTLRHAKKIVCLSNDQRNFLLNQGISNDKLVRIHYGIDKNFFTPSSVEGSYILSVGKDKGRDYRTLIEAAALVNAPVLIIAAKRNIEDEGILSVPSNVTIEYNKSYTQYRDMLKNAAIVVVPLKKNATGDSSDCSGQTVALEALSTKKPLIVSRRAWADEYISNDDALLLEQENSGELAAVIQRLWDDRDMRRRLSESGRRLIEQELNTERMGKEIATILQG